MHNALHMNNKLTPSRDALNELRSLRDEIRVKLRLAEMDARTWWEDVEPRLEALEDRLETGLDRATSMADVVVDELAKAFRRVRDRMDDQRR